MKTKNGQSINSEVSVAEFRANLEDIKRQNVEAASREINSILEKYQCKLVPYVVEGPDGRSWGTKLVSA